MEKVRWKTLGLVVVCYLLTFSSWCLAKEVGCGEVLTAGQRTGGRTRLTTHEHSSRTLLPLKGAGGEISTPSSKDVKSLKTPKGGWSATYSTFHPGATWSSTV